MKSFVYDYLNITRGKNAYRKAYDEVIGSLVKQLRPLLERNKIEVVFIWSQKAKNEVISFNEGHVVIWDINYWLHFAYYAKYMHILSKSIEAEPQGSSIECDAIWRDLFRLAFPLVKAQSPQHQLLFTKYYLSYGMRVMPEDHMMGDSEQNGALQSLYRELRCIATAKLYCFFHEIAHITYKEQIDIYLDVLNVLFEHENRCHTYDFVANSHPQLNDEDREKNKEKLSGAEAELKEGNYGFFEEIIADMRAFHSICTHVKLLYPKSKKEIMLSLRDGIVMARSFNLRSRSVVEHLKILIELDDEYTFRRKLLDSQFGSEFLIRDLFLEIAEPFLFHQCFGEDFFENCYPAYLQQSSYSQNAAQMVDVSLDFHLANVRKWLVNDLNVSPLEDVASYPAELKDYLLYYKREEMEAELIANPKEHYGLTGSFIDEGIF